MKKVIICVLSFIIVITSCCFAKVYVKGYFRKDGTYVAPHYRTNPDSKITNNYSYPGNYNPNTGKITGGSSIYSPSSTTNSLINPSTTPLTNYQATTYASPTKIQVEKPTYPVKINGTNISTYSGNWEPITYNNITYIPMTSSVIEELGLTSSFDSVNGFNLNQTANQSPEVLLIVLDPTTMKFHSTTDCADLKNIDDYRSCPNCIE